LHYRSLRPYKYQILKPCSIVLGWPGEIHTDFLQLSGGVLTVKKGYAWDGASGPTWDDSTNMRGSLFHDAIYQLIDTGELSAEFKDAADQLLRNLCIEDGMSKFRANYYYQAVKHFGGRRWR
jgi:hypothetical protein